MNQQEAFINILLGAMQASATTGELCQLKCSCLDKNGKTKEVRIVVVPEMMTTEFRHPLGSKENPLPYSDKKTKGH